MWTNNPNKMLGHAPSFDDPIGLLTACHDNIRRFCALSLKLDTHVSQKGVDQEAALAATNILRYFDTAAPLHHTDEEEDLFPSLLALNDPKLSQNLKQIEAEHAELAVLWGSVRPWLQAIADYATPVRPPSLITFAHDYPAHAAREETLLYPAAQLLPADTLAQLGRNMSKRRGVSL